jgi:hypothetical protein
MRLLSGCTLVTSILHHARSATLGVVLPATLLLCARITPAQVNNTTYQGNNARTGLNAHEIILTPSNVTSSGFGQLFTYPVDGYVYAQPLYLSNIIMADNKPHNVVFVATENDSVYAFDADDPTGANAPYLWLTSFLTNGETTVPYQDTGTFDINPQIGITGTPVIDTVNGTLYVVAKTKDAQGNYHQRLHALSVTTGLDKPGSPQEITATAQGIGDGSVNGVITFNPLRQNQRPALLFSNGNVYITWASHGDVVGNALNGAYPEGYHGWVIAYHYDETQHTFTQVGALNLTPNGVSNPPALAAGGVWMCGDGPAADSAGNIYFITGNGDFNGVSDFGDSFIKLAPDLSFTNFFSPYNQANLSVLDEDLGSGGIMLLPDTLAVNGHSPLMIGAGKQGNIYLIDRNNLGLNAPLLDSALFSDYVVQKLPNAIGPSFGTPAWFNNTLYYGGINDTIKSFQFVTTQTHNAAYLSGFAGETDLSLNGAAISGTRLRLTDGNGYEAHSAFTTYKVCTSMFRNTFHFQIANAGGVGFTFTLQGISPEAVGNNGGNVGYGGVNLQNPGIGNSVAIKFCCFPSASGESNSSTGLVYGGNSPASVFVNLDANSPVEIGNGDIFEVSMYYDGTNLTVTVTDTGATDPTQPGTNKGPSVTETFPIDIPGKIGSPYAYVGFTAGTGGAAATQDILDWNYRDPVSSDTELTQVGQTTTNFVFPGTTPTISSIGAINGIVWARYITTPDNPVQTTTLHAYDADNLANELYNSDMEGTRDAIGPGVKYSVPVVANGKVFLGTTTKLVAFGLLNRNFAVLNVGYSTIRRIGATYTVLAMVTNTGNLQATNVQITGCKLNNISPSRGKLPLNLGTALPGQTITAALTFPLSVGPSGRTVPLTITGTGLNKDGSTANFTTTLNVTLPY